MFHRIYSLFKLNDKVNTSVTTAGQSCQNYIGPKRENPQACLTNPVYAIYPWRWRGLESPLLIKGMVLWMTSIVHQFQLNITI